MYVLERLIINVDLISKVRDVSNSTLIWMYKALYVQGYKKVIALRELHLFISELMQWSKVEESAQNRDMGFHTDIYDYVIGFF